MAQSHGQQRGMHLRGQKITGSQFVCHKISINPVSAVGLFFQQLAEGKTAVCYIDVYR